MVEEQYLPEIQEAFGYLFEPELLNEMATVGRYQTIREGEILMDLDQQFNHMPMLLDGVIKIMREDKEGNELLLYYLESGDTCAMSFSCCMSARRSKIRAVAEEDARMIMIPVENMDKWMQDFKSWKQYVFSSIDTRMDEFLEALDTIAFMKMDERLLKYLRDKALVTGKVELHTTHQEIAADLHTSRVVVSRLLKKLENDGLVALGRNKINLKNLLERPLRR